MQDITTNPEVVFSIVKKQPDFAISVGQVDLLQTDHVLVTQFTQQLHNRNVHMVTIKYNVKQQYTSLTPLIFTEQYLFNTVSLKKSL